MAMDKVSVTLPRELAEEAKARAGEGGLSRFVAESLEARLRSLKLLEAVDAFEAQYGAIDDETLERARKWLP